MLAGQAPPPELLRSPPQHYALVMSADDSICKPLLKIYQDGLDDLLAHPIKEYNPDLVKQVTYNVERVEVTNPQAFRAAGFEVPPIVAGSQWFDPVYSVDLFHDGTTRYVLVAEEVGNMYDDGSTVNVYVARRGTTLATLKPLVEDGVMYDPKVENSGGQLPFFSEQLPPFAEFEAVPPDGEFRGGNIRMYVKNGTPMFVANESAHSVGTLTEIMLLHISLVGITKLRVCACWSSGSPNDTWNLTKNGAGRE